MVRGSHVFQRRRWVWEKALRDRGYLELSLEVLAHRLLYSAVIPRGLYEIGS